MPAEAGTPGPERVGSTSKLRAMPEAQLTFVNPCDRGLIRFKWGKSDVRLFH